MVSLEIFDKSNFMTDKVEKPSNPQSSQKLTELFTKIYEAVKSLGTAFNANMERGDIYKSN